MELPQRDRGDELLKAGDLLDLRQRLRRVAPAHDLSTVIANAFDHRTRLLPFIFTDRWMVPAGVRAIGSAMLDCGFAKTRILLQQWNRNFRPSEMRLAGRIPDLFMVSSLQLHYGCARQLLRDVCQIDAHHRPLVLAGGSKFVYEPWDAFSPNAAEPWAADVAVTGEEYVLLSLLEVLLSVRGKTETMRTAFVRARDAGLLDRVPGLVYARSDGAGRVTQLVDTGVQRLLSDLDETPHPVLGFSILERPSSGRGLAAQPLAAEQVARHARICSLVISFGCKFSCPYCPIPAYNQRKLRYKSPERIADEFTRLHETYGLRNFFGTDDNFLADPQRALAISQKLASTQIRGRRLKQRLMWGTEATVHDTLKFKAHLGTLRDAGVEGLWLGVEDMTATLVKKGQSVDRTLEAFSLLRQNGICPMAMMMHHDSQPFFSRGTQYGLFNQIRLLQKAGAAGCQVLMISPSVGAKHYRETYASGLVYARVGAQRIEPHLVDGNHVTASTHPQPWKKQLNIIFADAWFYNPVRLLAAVLNPQRSTWCMRVSSQLLGNLGLLPTLWKLSGWTLRLLTGKIERCHEAPASPWPMQSADGGAAAHALVAAEPQPRLRIQAQESLPLPGHPLSSAPTEAADVDRIFVATLRNAAGGQDQREPQP